MDWLGYKKSQEMECKKVRILTNEIARTTEKCISTLWVDALVAVMVDW